MNEIDVKKLSRLTAILTLLQTKRILTSTSLATKFGVSVRTIYRDIKSLEQAGIPIITEEGKGYVLMEGYRIPPMMFTEAEVNAIVTIEKLVQRNGDISLSNLFTEVVNKIKAVLMYTTKENADLLSRRIAVSPGSKAKGTNFMPVIQQALIRFNVLDITYHSGGQDERTQRCIEPFAMYYSNLESWTLIAYCRLRRDFRMFRIDRILKIVPLDIKFKPHKLTLDEYLAGKEKKFQNP
jgi:predicted DNA-binding transcriptional regulator YafY